MCKYLLGLLVTGAASGQVLPDDETVLPDKNNTYAWENQEPIQGRNTPLDLNTADEQDLEQLPGINANMADAILWYRRTYGDFCTLYELAYIPELPADVLHRILPFVTVDHHRDPGWPTLAHRGRWSITSRYQQKFVRPQVSEPYEGNDLRMWSRIEYTSMDRLRVALTMDKDPGESLLRTHRPTVDYTSAFVYKTSTGGVVRQWIVGDYQLSFGQGLTLWTAFSAPSEARLPKTARHIQAHTGSDENRFLRGAAATVSFGPWQVTPFFSLKMNDAHLTSDHTFSRFVDGGYHRTASELADRKTVRVTLAGANVAHVFRWGEWGIVSMREGYDRWWIPPVDKGVPTSPSVKYTQATGTYCTVRFRHGDLYGEQSFTPHRGSALLAGFALRSEAFTLDGVFRQINSTYRNRYSDIIRTSDSDGACRAALFRLRFMDAHRVSTSFLSEWMQHTGLTGNSTAPYGEYNWGIREELGFWSGNLYTSAYGTMNTESGEHRIRIRLHATTQVTPRWRYQARLEVTDPGQQAGYLVYHDWRYQAGNLTVYGRITWFHTHDYAHRIYAFENDVGNTWSVPFFYGEGAKVYIGIQRKWRCFQLWFKYGHMLQTTESVALNRVTDEGKIQLRLLWPRR
ncbi:MAG: helix-hairpin-helix domain-containing protein [Flavobacteriales bacterium]|nr:helix-hairpin-helix domain-containing protein [Flavobacteriales bacterium]MCB9446916.1 helix-hairpin-helix domain-containing protein [Flavobacteriales bacterium]